MSYLKIGGLIGIVALVLGLIWHFNRVEEKKDNLLVENTKQGQVINAQDNSIKTGEIVTEVKEKTGLAIAVETGQKVEQQKKVTQKAEHREAEIVQHFDQLPVTTENAVEKQQQLSSSRIDQLWEAYCLGVPDAEECKVPQPTPQGA